MLFLLLQCDNGVINIKLNVLRQVRINDVGNIRKCLFYK